MEKISPTHPRRFALQSGPPLFGLGAGGLGATRGFLFFSRASEKKFELRFSGISIFPGRNLSSKKFFEFLFRSGISRSEIEFLPTEEHEGVRIGSGGNPKRRTMTKSRKFLIHQINRSSFVARKQRIFDGIQTHRDMDGGKNRQAKTEPKERNF